MAWSDSSHDYLQYDRHLLRRQIPHHLRSLALLLGHSLETKERQGKGSVNSWQAIVPGFSNLLWSIEVSSARYLRHYS